MSNLIEIKTYRTLVDCLSDKFVVESEIAKVAAREINKAGPFEAGVFFEHDIIVMLTHLFASDLIERNIIEKNKRYDGSAINEIYYKKKQELQPDLFSFMSVSV